MVRIIYQHPDDWLQAGLLRVDAHLQDAGVIPPDMARRPLLA